MKPDIAIAGGGLAGAAAACRLARAGQRVLVLERFAGPHHKVCGEFISGEAEQALEDLGLSGILGRLGAIAVERVRLVAGQREVVAALPFRAFGLSRYRLDACLLDHAERLGAIVRRGVPVRSIAPEGAGIRLTGAGEPIRVAAAMLATGKHDLRGCGRTTPPSTLIGLKLHLRLDASAARSLAGHVELALFPGGYAGLQAIEDGRANACLVVEKKRFAQLGRDWRRLVASVPHLERRLAGASTCTSAPIAVYRIPYGHLHRGGDDAPIYRLGDQLAVIHSFTGDGMAMALRSAECAAAAVLAGKPATAYHADIARAFGPAVRLAGAVAQLAAVAPLQAPLVAACCVAPTLVTSLAAWTRAAA